MTKLILGDVSVRGEILTPHLISLPTLGTLYQVGFTNTPNNYNNVDLNVSNLTPITNLSQGIANPRGIVIYVPKLRGFSSPDGTTNQHHLRLGSIYETFNFVYYLGNVTQQNVGTVSVIVNKVNHAPVAVGQTVNVSNQGVMSLKH